MGSWSYVSEGKGFVCDESISVLEEIGRGKNGLMGWELNFPYSSSMVVGSETAIEKQGSVELGFPEMTRKSWPVNNSVKDVSICRGVGERMCNQIASTMNAFSGEEESSSKISGCVLESKSRDASLIDLKLGRFADNRDAKNLDSFKAAPMLSSAESSAPTKRARAGLSAQTPFCQVYGCKKDLSSSKDYHKRHKVCEIHSRTSKVIVNGIEQRFCQQCSRFHLLAEFDDGKRSCRKRLAGHNERRRKPHVGMHSGKTGRLLQSYIGSAGNRFQGSMLASSFICHDILPSKNLTHLQKNDINDWSSRIKLVDGAEYCPQSSLPITNGHVLPKSLFCHALECRCPPFHATILYSATGRDFVEKSNRSPHDLGAPSSVAGSLIQSASSGSDDFILFDSVSTVEGLSGMSASGRALSLLSPQSHISSSHSAGIPMAQPLIGSGSHAHLGVGNSSGKLLGVSPQASTSGLSYKLNSIRVNSVLENHFGPILISDDGDAVNFSDGIFQGSPYMKSKDRLSCEDGPTIDLLQLSSHLQCVEHQRQSIQVKQENDAFRGFKIT